MARGKLYRRPGNYAKYRQARGDGKYGLPLRDPYDITVSDTAPKFAYGTVFRGAQARGIGYERKVQGLLRGEIVDAPGYEDWELWCNPWFKFFEKRKDDREYTRFASPDIVILGPRDMYILECKLTYTTKAEAKLRGVYQPLCEAVWGTGRETHLIQVASNLYRGAKPRLIDHWLEADTEYMSTWNWRPGPKAPKADA